MSRLTKRENGELYYRQGENYAWSKPINKGNVKYPTLSKLAHYEDLEEQDYRMVNINKIIEQLEELEKEYPYKVVGEPETYSQYNEGWSDCIDRAIGIVKGSE